MNILHIRGLLLPIYIDTTVSPSAAYTTWVSVDADRLINFECQKGEKFLFIVEEIAWKFSLT